MDRNQVQTALVSTYQRWKSGFDARGITVEHFSPPLLLNLTDDYCDAPIKIVFCGQETTGWTHLYSNNWPFKDLLTFGDFLNNDDAIEGLVQAYEQFAFAKYQPKIFRSPFWQAFREIQKWPNAGLMWTNIIRVDYHGGSILTADSTVQEAILQQQYQVLRDELTLLMPSVCIFVTGPDYDPVLRAAFPTLEFKEIDLAPKRELARLVHSDLPARSYRTYHPKPLSMHRKWGYLEVISKFPMQ
jgi:hypothetical protein